jgi:hypothetical protein
MVETLETRALFSATFDPGDTFATALNLGDLVGQRTFTGAVNLGNLTDFYKFTVPQGGKLSARFRTNVAGTQIDLFREQIDAKGNPQEISVDTGIAALHSPPDGFASGDLSGESLTAGTYFIEVSERGLDTAYLMTLTPDYAGDSLKTARNIGIATDATLQDYIGITPDLITDDFIDVFKTTMEAPGRITARLSLDNTSEAQAHAYVQIIHDFNGNGVIDAQDVLAQAIPSNITSTTADVPAGTYFLRVSPSFNAANYHLNVNADYAGTTAGHTRAAGSLDSIKTFHDFIGNPSDIFDDYKFGVTSTRPFFAAMAEAGDGKAILALYNDLNNDGAADQLVASSGAGQFETLLRTIDAGHYVVRVQALSGSGTYVMSAEARPDGAGNTLATAKNLGTINGLTHRDDYVSDADTVDFYKFTAAAPGTVGASLGTEFGGDADLALIRDANNNGKVDTNEILASGALTSFGSKELSKSISAGNYFLRVTHKGPVTVAKYFLSFQTDYAGSTPKTARSVGTLAGTKTFDDWASGPFTGAISDIADVYKFSLSSTKTFSAKTIGVLSGQDLDLQLYRDKNNDGVLSANELVASSHKANSPNEQISKSLTSGTYFLKVVGVNGETNYHLTLKA